MNVNTHKKTVKFCNNFNIFSIWNFKRNHKNPLILFIFKTYCKWELRINESGKKESCKLYKKGGINNLITEKWLIIGNEYMTCESKACNEKQNRFYHTKILLFCFPIFIIFEALNPLPLVHGLWSCILYWLGESWSLLPPSAGLS